MILLSQWASFWLLLSVSVLSPIFQPASAAESQEFSNPAVAARLISAEDGIEPGAASVSLGLALDYRDGWKGYWRTPGEVGLAPEIDWSGSSNLKTAEILWPAPKRFEAFGIENFGYSGAVVLPIRTLLEDPGSPLTLRARVSLLTCSDVCVPHVFDLALDLPSGTGIDSGSAGLIAEHAARVPATPEESDIELQTVALDDRASSLVVAARSDQPFRNADVFPEFGPLVTFGKPIIRFSRDRRGLWARVPLNAWSDEYSAPAITITDAERALTAPVEISPDVPAPPYTTASFAHRPFQLLSIAAIALLGGLILNVMPCVLPVLSIKLASVLKTSRQSQREVRNGFLFSALGVLTFVWLLAALVLTLKWIGVSVGWGIQFQNPVFVAIMFMAVAVFAANLFGAFEIALPASVQNRLGDVGNRSGHLADFGTGLMAAILATPCSAPFLGTAISFALAGNAIDVLIVFTALGVGLASPYILVGIRPGLVARLPRPGRWMLLVRIALGALLLTTAVWLLSVLGGIAGWPAAALVALATVALVALSSSQWPKSGVRGALMAASVSLALFGAGMLPKQQNAAQDVDATHWKEFAPRDVARHVSEGHVVFVDVTADWCLTCKANKTLVLDRNPVFDRLNDEAVIAMQADWTRPDDQISRFLERHGRFGIPFNIVFGPGDPSGIAMPEVLTPALVLEALDSAAARTVAAE